MSKHVHLLDPATLYAPRSLFSYQQNLANATVERILALEKTCSVLATGGGKSLSMTEVVRQILMEGTFKRVVILCHSVDILEQLEKDLALLRLPIGWFAAGHHEHISAPIQMVSASTVVARLKMPKWSAWLHLFRREDTLVLADECHRSLSGIIGEFFTGGKCLITGWTATPWKTGNSTLADIFDTLVPGPLPVELIKMGRLVEPRYVTDENYADLNLGPLVGGDFSAAQISRLMRQPGVSDYVVATVRRMIPHGKLIYFVSDKLHAEDIAKAIVEYGGRAEVITSTSDGREPALVRLKHPKGPDGVSIDVLSTGIDVPDLVGIVMLRHTMSPIIYGQQKGRALRVFPGKEFAYIVDFVGNVRRHWRLEDIEEYSFDRPKARGTRAAATKICPNCATENGTFAMRCKKCDFLFEESCPGCQADLYVSQDICRKCGFDRRDAEQQEKEFAAALSRMKILQEVFNENYFIDSEASFKYDWHSLLYQAYEGQLSFREILHWLQSQLKSGVGMEAVIGSTVHTLWPADQARTAFEHYAELLLERQRDGQYELSTDESHTVFALEFGHAGKTWFSEYIKQRKYAVRKGLPVGSTQQWFKKKPKAKR